MAVDPGAAGASGAAAVAETHSGVVFFLGERAYKLKKAVDLGFLDFRSREARRVACEREVSLNRRLAPDVYLGVADVTGPDGRPCDHLVVMRRMPEERRLSSLVASGAAVHGHLERLAERLARFHRAAETAPPIDRAASQEADAARWEANAAEMAPFRAVVLEPAVLDETTTLARRYVAGRGPLFAERIAEGRARDGHGDLLADDIFCLDDGPRVLDCLEFDDRLRFGDVLADVAFLAMDLERLGSPDLAASFLAHYQRASGDSWPASLAHHYIAYRAQVRAKVACVRWSQGDARSGETAGELLRLCLDHLRRARVRLVLVGGLPGTGKSTVARAIGPSLDAAVLHSDEIRKEVAGLDPLARAPAALDEGLYRPEMSDATYTELLRRAAVSLGLGRSVVLAATWGEPSWREAAAHLAAETSSDLVELRCAAPFAVASDRIRRRAAEGADPSDVSEDIAPALWSRERPWPTATTLDTSGRVEETVAAALAAAGGGEPSSGDGQ